MAPAVTDLKQVTCGRRQKVHAQQHPLHASPASSLERNTEPPRVTGTYDNIDSVCVIERGMPHAQLTSLV